MVYKIFIACLTNRVFETNQVSLNSKKDEGYINKLKEKKIINVDKVYVFRCL